MEPNARLLKLPQNVRYVMSAAKCLAALKGERFHLVDEVARRTGLRHASLAKALQELARKGIVESRRGPSGGYRLAPGARKLSLSELVAAARRAAGSGECMLEARACDRKNPCSLHPVVDACERLLAAELETRRLGDL